MQFPYLKKATWTGPTVYRWGISSALSKHMCGHRWHTQNCRSSFSLMQNISSSYFYLRIALSVWGFRNEVIKTILFSVQDLSTKIPISQLRLSPLRTDLHSRLYACGRSVKSTLRNSCTKTPTLYSIISGTQKTKSRCPTIVRLCSLHVVGKSTCRISTHQERSC